MTNISALEFIILALGVFRLTRIITTDAVLNSLRERIWKKYPPERGGIGYLITCDWCSSIWTSSLVVVMYTIFTAPVFAVMCVLALSAVAGALTARV
jgi:hypothetical protein